MHVRGEGTRALEARINRAVYYELVDLGTEHHVDDEAWFGVWSGGVFFRMQRMAEISG